MQLDIPSITCLGSQLSLTAGARVVVWLQLLITALKLHCKVGLILFVGYYKCESAKCETHDA